MEVNKIYNEDCLITMQKIENIDAVITSPPYNTSRKGSSLDNACANVRYDEFDDCKTDEEYIAWTIDIFKSYNKVLKPNGVILYNLSYSSENTHLMWLVVAEIMKQTNFIVADNIIWKKPSTSPNSCSPNKLTRIIEYVFVFCRKDINNLYICIMFKDESEILGIIHLYEVIPVDNEVIISDNEFIYLETGLVVSTLPIMN